MKDLNEQNICLDKTFATNMNITHKLLLVCFSTLLIATVPCICFAVVVDDSLNVREKPDLDSSAIENVKEGEEFFPVPEADEADLKKEDGTPEESEETYATENNNINRVETEQKVNQSITSPKEEEEVTIWKIVAIIIGIIFGIIAMVFFFTFAFWVFLILGPIASIVILYEAQKNGGHLDSGDKGVLVVTAITWAGYIIYSLANRGTSRSDSGENSSYDYSPSSSETLPNEKERDKWPLGESELIIGHKNIYEKGCFYNTKVGHVEKNLCGDKEIHKDGLFFSDKIGKVETNFFGSPTSIVDNHGDKIGDIKTTWTGRKIIVDEDGNEIGEYKD